MSLAPAQLIELHPILNEYEPLGRVSDDRGVRQLFCNPTAAALHIGGPVGVKRGGQSHARARPHHLSKRTLPAPACGSLECQKATYAAQQRTELFDHLVGERDRKIKVQHTSSCRSWNSRVVAPIGRDRHDQSSGIR
jgi:hypothetical protein